MIKYALIFSVLFLGLNFAFAENKTYEMYYFVNMSVETVPDSQNVAKVTFKRIKELTLNGELRDMKSVPIEMDLSDMAVMACYNLALSSKGVLGTYTYTDSGKGVSCDFKQKDI